MWTEQDAIAAEARRRLREEQYHQQPQSAWDRMTHTDQGIHQQPQDHHPAASSPYETGGLESVGHHRNSKGRLQQQQHRLDPAAMPSAGADRRKQHEHQSQHQLHSIKSLSPLGAIPHAGGVTGGGTVGSHGDHHRSNDHGHDSPRVDPSSLPSAGTVMVAISWSW
jgi:hypothetical protein